MLLHSLTNQSTLPEPVFRLAEKEWIAFVDAFITTLVEVDDEIPPLPPKDVIHRIYRDVICTFDHFGTPADLGSTGPF